MALKLSHKDIFKCFSHPSSMKKPQKIRTPPTQAQSSPASFAKCDALSNLLTNFPDLKYEPQKVMPQIKKMVGMSIRATNFGNVMRFSPERHCLLPKSYSLQIPDCMSHLNSNVWKSQKNAKKITKNMNPNLNRNALNMIDPLIEVYDEPILSETRI